MVCVSPEKRQPAPLPKHEGDECAICLHPFETNTICTLMCDHSFHIDCLKKMISKGGITCPLCRAALPPFEITEFEGIRQEGVRLCRLAIKLNPSRQTFMTWIRILESITSSKGVLVEALNYFPEDLEFRFLQAEIYITEKDFSSAMDEYNKIIIFSSSKINGKCRMVAFITAAYNKSLVLFNMGNKQESLTQLEHVMVLLTETVEKKPSKPAYYDLGGMVAEVWNMLGCLLLNIGAADAQKAFVRAIKAFPKTKNARLNWAKWLMLHEPHRAARMFSKMGVDPTKVESVTYDYFIGSFTFLKKGFF